MPVVIQAEFASALIEANKDVFTNARAYYCDAQNNRLNRQGLQNCRSDAPR